LQTTLRAQSTISRKSRGRRGASMYEPGTNEFGLMSPPIQEMGALTLSPTSIPTNPGMFSSPTATATPPRERTLSPVRYADSDTRSLSSTSTARPSGLSLHPDLEVPGLNVSILESLSAILSEGYVQKIFVIGEIAISSQGQRVTGIHILN